MILWIAPGCSSLGLDDDDGNGRDVVRDTRASVSDVPDNARRVKDGTGTLRFTANDDGRVYIVDLDDNSLVSEQRVRDGNRLEVMPGDDRIMLDGRVVYDHDLKRDNRHAIYFLSEDDRDRDSGSMDLPRDLRDADRVASGRGDLTFLADDDGRVYVWDRTDRKIVYESKIRDGDRLVVSPDSDLITNSGSDARIRNKLDRDHSYEIYFDDE
jgi:hypothetical protein